MHRWCAERRAWFVSDGIYHQIEYGSERARTALESPGASETALVINSCGKYHCLTGWRVGWCVVPPALRETMRALQQNLFINAPHVSQIAATRAFDCDEELQTHVERYRENREILLEGLPKAGFTKLSSAGGAYYIYADVSHLTDDSVGLCRRILDVTGVACVPGVDFDRERGRRSSDSPSAIPRRPLRRLFACSRRNETSGKSETTGLSVCLFFPSRGTRAPAALPRHPSTVRI